MILRLRVTFGALNHQPGVNYSGLRGAHIEELFAAWRANGDLSIEDVLAESISLDSRADQRQLTDHMLVPLPQC